MLERYPQVSSPLKKMRDLSRAVATLYLAQQAVAFVPHSIRSATASSKSVRHFGVDPSAFHDLSHHIQHLPDAFSSFNLADADVKSFTDAATSAMAPATDAVMNAASDAATEVAKKDNGWFGFLTEPISLLLQVIHSGLMAGGMSENSWGVSIVVLTVLIKALTFPLTKTQLESTNKMQVRNIFGFNMALAALLHF